MPIVFVHGVGNRKSDKDYAHRWWRLERMLRRYVAPALSDDPGAVPILDAYWGNLGASFAWNGQSRPRSPLLGMGAGAWTPNDFDQAAALATFLDGVTTRLPAPSSAPAAGSGLLPMGSGTGAVGGGVRLSKFTETQLSDLLAAVVARAAATYEEQATLAIAADDVAHDPSTNAALAAMASLDQELVELKTRIEQRVAAGGLGVLGMGGGPSWWEKFRDGVKETTSRVGSAPGFALSRLAAEVRGPLNDFISVFLGDVFTYLRHRGVAKKPGAIPRCVLGKLREASEHDGPLVVLSHSMGGQIVYDLVTHFIPAQPEAERVRVDYWCATASQVGLFEELKLFGASSDAYGATQGRKAPRPDSKFLGGWWNVWDHNDFISYTADPVIADIDDASYSSGMSLLAAHSGYLERPTFFREFAVRLKKVKAKGWK